MDNKVVTAALNAILTNPRAAERFKTDYAFRVGLQSSLASLGQGMAKNPDPNKNFIARLFPQMKIESSGGKLRIRYAPLNQSFDDINDALEAAIRNPTIRATTNFTADGFDAVAYQTNEIFNKVFVQKGFTVQQTSYNVRSRYELERFDRDLVAGKDSSGNKIYRGFIQPSKGKNLVARVYRSDGSELTGAEIQSQLRSRISLDPQLFKRGTYVTSPRGLVLAGLPANKMPLVHLYDPEEFLQKMTGDQYNAVKKFFPNAKNAEMASSGMNLMTIAGHKRVLMQMRKEAEADILRGGDYAVVGRERLALIRKRLAHPEGGYYTQTIGAREENGALIDFLKSDVEVMTPQKQRYIQKMLGLSDDQMERLTFISSRRDVKPQASPSLTGNLLSLDPRPVAGRARSNLFSAMVHQNILGDENYLVQSTQREMNRHLTDLQKGKLTPGLINTLRDIATQTIREDLTPAEEAAALDSRAFAERIIGMIDSGADVANSDSIMTQISNSIKKHYIRKRSGHAEGTLMHRGIASPYYEMSFAEQGGVGAHLSLNINPVRLGVAEIDKATKRWSIAGVDMMMYNAAWGGSDFDDRVASHSIAYDPKTRRAFVALTRDPTGAGEYVYADVNIASLTFDDFMPPEIRTMHGKINEINKFIRAEKAKGVSQLDDTAQRHILALMSERDTLVVQIRNYFEGKSVNIKNGKKVTGSIPSNVQHLDLAAEYDPVTGRRFAPKGSIRSVEAISHYQAPDFDFSLLKVSELLAGHSPVKGRMTVSKKVSALFDIIDEGDRLDRDIQFGGRKPYEFAGLLRSEFHEKYFPVAIDKEESAKLVQDFQSLISKEFSSDVWNKFLEERLDNEADNVYKLGRISNLTKGLEATIQSHVNNLSSEALGIFNEQIESVRMSNIVTEDVVDASVKTMNAKYLAQAEAAAINNWKIFAQAMAGTRLAMAKLGIVGETIGVDPMLFERLIKTNQEAKAAMESGWKAGIGDVKEDIFLGPDDEKSFMSHLYDETQGLLARYEEGALDIGPAARARHLASLEEVGFKSTAAERTMGSEILQAGMKAKRAKIDFLREVNPDFVQMMWDMDQTLDIDVSAELMQKMHEFELFDVVSDVGATEPKYLQQTERAHRMMLTMSQILAENEQDDSILREIGSSKRAMNAGWLYNDAIRKIVNEPKIFDEISKFTAEDVLANLEIARERIGTGRFDDFGHEVIEKQRVVRIKKGSRAAQIADDQIAFSHIQGRINALTLDSGAAESLDEITSLIEQGNYRTQLPRYQQKRIPTYGTRRYALREDADIVADTVTRSSKQPFKHIRDLDKEAFAELWKHPGARRTMIGAGIFAGFGILYRLTKDPTPEDMQGPPLLPAGNPYEGVDAAPAQAMSSMFPSYGGNSAQGMLYQIRASGNFDAHKFNAQIQSATGISARGSVYQARQTIQPRQNSRNRLKSAMGA